jgi:hypothetical protein
MSDLTASLRERMRAVLFPDWSSISRCPADAVAVSSGSVNLSDPGTLNRPNEMTIDSVFSRHTQ